MAAREKRNGAARVRPRRCGSVHRTLYTRALGALGTRLSMEIMTFPASDAMPACGYAGERAARRAGGVSTSDTRVTCGNAERAIQGRAEQKRARQKQGGVASMASTTETGRNNCAAKSRLSHC